ncbi:hypothetical protein [Winogradskyella sp. SYSU M77433]|uniref:helix-turn-helix domain-containing protein n=1 Tax=Winogradskyella sp. SYSU M77433 TaxID=3042722 RepID=UPI002481335B|nr:hypothetical protein [Winogradskyella sp. SYSU M77433]MDH7911358.1 hypothetical protein [Winogradskyella sp. SYSU M77433]
MHIKFNYPHKIRSDFLHDVVKQLIRQRYRLGITQDELNHTLGVADRLVSHWECGVRSPTAFHLYCWADALQSKLMIIPKGIDADGLINLLEEQSANDNSQRCERSVNDNKPFIPENRLRVCN